MIARPHPIWFVAGAASVGVLALVAYVARAPEPRVAMTLELPGSPPAALEAWCADGLEPIAANGCFARAREASVPTTLVVYLHGRYSPAMIDEELDRQSRVARIATARGFAVLALRGNQGECTSADLKDFWCWPSNERNASDGPAFVARWETALAAARERIGAGPNVLLGFSNGGYFAALVATRALARFDAIAIAHGGPVEPTRAAGPAVPMLLVTADDDASDPEMQRLDDELSAIAWPHVLVAREGGHALPDWDIDAAITFFSRVKREKLPLSPPLASRSPRPRVIVDASTDDAGLELAVDGSSDLGDP